MTSPIKESKLVHDVQPLSVPQPDAGSKQEQPMFRTDELQGYHTIEISPDLFEKDELNIILQQAPSNLENDSQTVWETLSSSEASKSTPLAAEKYVLYQCNNNKTYHIAYTKCTTDTEQEPPKSKDFICDVEGCGRGFTTQGYLHLHQLIHKYQNDHSTLTCNFEGCNRKFSWPAHLKYHKLTHLGKRPFRCDHPGCGKDFYTGQRLTVHKRIHNGNKPYVCEVEGCNKAFTTAGNLKNHARIHTGEKPYSCDVEGCGKCFSELSSLKKHKVVHSGKKPYQCDICGQSFTQSASRNVHMKKAHTSEDLTPPTTPLPEPMPTQCFIVTSDSDGKLHYTGSGILDLTADPPLMSTSSNVVLLSEPEEVVPMTTGYHDGVNDIREEVVYGCTVPEEHTND